MIASLSSHIHSLVQKMKRAAPRLRDSAPSWDNRSLPLSVSKMYFCSRRKVPTRLFLGCYGSLDTRRSHRSRVSHNPFHGQTELAHYPRTGEGPLIILDFLTLFLRGGSVDACSTQAVYELIFVSEWEHSMIQPLRRNDRTFDHAVHT